MKAIEIRNKYLNFFKNHGHAVIPSAPLIPENDPSVLFTTAGMQPLVPYLLGEKHPEGTRLTDYQKCVRTNDIDEVGDNRHLTYFEMLGNWSLGDYFKEESIAMSFEFLKKQLDEKDKQISELHKLIENSQILLKEEQKKSEQQLYLAEHFEEVDNKLQDLKEKMEQKRNEKIKFFKIFSK